MLQSAKILLRPARIPVSPKSRGPSTFRQLQFLSVLISAGMLISWQTTESSSGVWVIEQKLLPCAHEGISESFSSLQISNLPSRRL